jgi:hypothetical protein
LQISGRAVFNRQADAFRKFVGVDFGDRLAYLAKGRGSCLDDQKPFASFFHLALPAVDGCDLGDDIDAGGQAALHQNVRDPVSFFRGAGGGEDDSFVSHMESAFNNRQMNWASDS